MPRAGAAPSAFHLMAKPTGAVCNLDCEYCYFLSKEQLYPHAGFRMDPAVHEAYVGQLLAAHEGVDEVVVAFQGGEPTLMGVDFFRRTLELEERLRRPGQRVLNTIQTNGTLLDDEWGAFLAEHEFLVGVSVDGPRELHDAYRVDKGGKPTFDRVVRGIDVLVRHGVAWNALTTVNAANGDHGREVYAFLRDDLGARFVQLIPVVERVTAELLPQVEHGWGRRVERDPERDAERDAERPVYRQQGELVTHRSVGAEQYGQFLVEVFEEWVRHDVGEVFVQLFDTALAHWMGMDDVGLCIHARTCGKALALEHNGDVYSCDHYVEEGYRLGNLADGRPLLELVTSPRQERFGRDKLDSLPAYCLRCDVRFACNGGCPKDRFVPTPDGEPGLSYLCPGYQRFFRHVAEPMRAMAALVTAGHDASRIRDVYAEQDAARPGEVVCPCGSGRTWAGCHAGLPQITRGG